MPTYLITGVAGFIAARVAEFLLADGHQVVGVDNLNDAYDVALKRWRLDRLLAHPNFRFRQLDISDRAGVSRLATAGVEYAGVVNLAARAGVRQSTENPWIYIDTNVTGTLNLLEFCREHRIPKFVLASTSSLYGGQNTLPYREDADTNRPLSPYAASKKGAEALCHTFHHLYGLDITVFRYFTVYGPAGRPDMSVLRFVQWISEGRPVVIYGDGSQSRDFTYVDDIARGTIAGLAPLGYRVINLGSDCPLGLMRLIEMIEDCVGEKAELSFRSGSKADVPATWADISCARALLGWEPRISHGDGIARVVEWYRQNREWASRIRTE